MDRRKSDAPMQQLNNIKMNENHPLHSTDTHKFTIPPPQFTTMQHLLNIPKNMAAEIGVYSIRYAVALTIFYTYIFIGRSVHIDVQKPHHLIKILWF